MTSQWSDLAVRATAVLDQNWLGVATKPGPRLYPHQWSWDSAFIAIGNRHNRWDRAALELETLFDAQWSSGLVPHIVFSETVEHYFPNADFWNSQEAAGAPRHVATSGIVQPPVHATAVRLVAESAPAGEGAPFVERMYPNLAAWHDYLYKHRCPDLPLAEVWHPWETGMDNSPAWDGSLDNLEFTAADVPPYHRVDTEIAAAEDRPTSRQYDQYAYLVGVLRRHGYEPREAASLPFRIQDVLFNSLLVEAGVDLAALAETVGEDPTPHLARSATTAAAINDLLWSDNAGMYVDRDAVSGDAIEQRICGGLVPLFADVAQGTRASTLLDTLFADFFEPVGEQGNIVPSVPVNDPEFDGRRYWRGPAWPQMNWLVRQGLLRQGLVDEASRIENGILSVADASGLWEYWDPTDGSGHGSDQFSWTSSVVLDFLAARRAGRPDASHP